VQWDCNRVYNVWGLAFILGLTSPNNQVALPTKERSAHCYGAPPCTRGGEGVKAAVRHKVRKKHREIFDFLFRLAAVASRQKAHLRQVASQNCRLAAAASRIFEKKIA